MAAHTQRSSIPARHEWLVFLGRSSVGIALAVLLFTALIWLRLRLVTDVPRRAYAEPKPQPQHERVVPERRERDAPARDR